MPDEFMRFLDTGGVRRWDYEAQVAFGGHAFPPFYSGEADGSGSLCMSGIQRIEHVDRVAAGTDTH